MTSYSSFPEVIRAQDCDKISVESVLDSGKEQNNLTHIYVCPLSIEDLCRIRIGGNKMCGFRISRSIVYLL